MRRRHVTHLLSRYVHGQLRPAQRARVVNHTRICADCRAALAREERIAVDLRRELPHFGQPRSGQLAQMWAEVWREIGPGGTPRPESRARQWPWLPGLSMVLAMAVILLVALPLLAHESVRVEAAPLQGQARPVSTASPTPGATDTFTVADAGNAAPDETSPTETAAAGFPLGASPVPMPGATDTPEIGSEIAGE